MTAYLTREAAEALRKKLEARSGLPPFCASGSYVALASAFAVIDSLPVVDAVPAEEALGVLVKYALNPGLTPISGGSATAGESIAIAEAAVRHALRAAQAQADAPKEETAVSDTRDPDPSYPNHRPGLPPAVKRMLEDRVRALMDTRMAYLDDTAEKQENAILRIITMWHLIDCTPEMAALRASATSQSDVRAAVIAEAKDVVRSFATIEQPTDKILAALDAILEEE